MLKTTKKYGEEILMYTNYKNWTNYSIFFSAEHSQQMLKKSLCKIAKLKMLTKKVLKIATHLFII